MKRISWAILILLVASNVYHCEEKKEIYQPAIVPMPKVYKPTGESWELNGNPIMIASSNRQCQIAADEIRLRIKELGGEPGICEEANNPNKAGIFILPITHSVAVNLAKKLNIKVTAYDPGPQGYVIRMSNKRVIIIGSDAVGTLYGAMTLRQMIRKGENGRIVVDVANVYDKPDYLIRSNMSFMRGLGHWAQNEKDTVAAYKAGIDWMMRFKINRLTDYMWGDVRQIRPETRTMWKEINKYAEERGIYTELAARTNIGYKELDKERDEFKNWDCVSTQRDYYCWSRDELTKEVIQRTVDVIKECGFRIFWLHPVDGGGITDPELWYSQRCNRCRERFGDRRWEASSHQYNMWAEALKKEAPNIIFISPIYVYNANYADYNWFTKTKTGSEIKKEVWYRNTIDYWKKVNENTDKILIPCTWMALPHSMEIYQECFKGRPKEIYGHSIIPLGYFGTWHRLNKTNYSGNHDDIFLLAGGIYGSWATWMNSICSCEFAWNTNAPGSAVYNGIYYDAERDHTEPKEIIEDWLLRACRAFFGEEVGRKMAVVYGAGVQPLYIQDPGRGIALANKYRLTPAADVDPTANPETTGVQEILAPVKDSPERMEFQVKATGKALMALEEAYPYLNTIDKYRRKTFMYFYKRMPLWHMIAKSRLAMYRAQAEMKEGRKEEAKKILEDALEQFEKDRIYAEEVIEKTRGESDLLPFPPLHTRGDVKPSPEELKKMLTDAITSISLQINPRKPGQKIKVGLYKGYGAEATKRFFERFKNVEAEIIDNLSLVTLDKYDCVFIFQTTSITEEDFFINLPRYVKEGGRGVVIQHDLIGYERSPFGKRNPFPEVVQYGKNRVDSKHIVDRYLKDGNNLIVKIEHPVVKPLAKGDTAKHMYYDHITALPGEKGIVVVVDGNNDPVVVVGTVGKGKVIFDGNVNIGEDERESDLTGINAILARGAVEWFTGIELIEGGGK
jgi:hypothetical protein